MPKTGRSGGSRTPCEPRPDDTRTVFRIGDYVVGVSREHGIVITTSDYHPSYLALSPDDLAMLLHELAQETEADD